MLTKAIAPLTSHFPNRLRDLHHLSVLYGFSEFLISGSGVIEQLIEVVTVVRGSAKQSEQCVIAAGAFPHCAPICGVGVGR